MALLEDGTVWTNNNHGQLGDGNTISSPRKVVGLEGVREIEVEKRL